MKINIQSKTFERFKLETDTIISCKYFTYPFSLICQTKKINENRTETGKYSLQSNHYQFV